MDNNQQIDPVRGALYRRLINIYLAPAAQNYLAYQAGQIIHCGSLCGLIQSDRNDAVDFILSINPNSDKLTDEYQRLKPGGLYLLDVYHSNFHRLSKSIDLLHGSILMEARIGFPGQLFAYLPRVYWSLEALFHPYVSFCWGLRRVLLIQKPMQLLQGRAGLLSIVIPAFDEAKRLPIFLNAIQRALPEIRQNLPQIHAGIEIIVVNDGSRDSTRSLCESYANVILLNHRTNYGKGAAVRSGILKAQGEWLLVCDADGATPIQELAELWKKLNQGYAVVLGSRYTEGAHIKKHQPLWRRWISRLGNLVIRLLTGLPYRDTQCGFKLYRQKDVVALFNCMHTQGFGFEVEFLSAARNSGLKIAEVGVRWSHTVGSQVRWFHVVRTLRDILYYRFQYLVRFILAGILNTLIDFFVHNALVVIFVHGHAMQQAIYQFVAYSVANIFSFIFNSSYTFRVRGSYLKFILISLVSLIVATFTHYWLQVLFNPHANLVLTNILKICTLLIGFCINYSGYRLLVFKTRV